MIYRALLRFFPQPFRIRAYDRALKKGKPGFALKLLKSGTIRGSSAQAVLDVTIQLGTESLLRKLLLSGAKAAQAHLLVEARNSKIEPFEKMRALVRAGADPNGVSGPKRLKLLNLAILNRDTPFFHFLIDQKIDTKTADRNGLLPIQAALILEEKDCEKVLGPYIGSETELLPLLESLVINENMLCSELHELLKWCFRNSGLELLRVTAPKTGLLRYRIRHHETVLRVELGFLSTEEITLLLFKGEAVTPVQSLLPLKGKIDSTTLRGHVVTELVEFIKSNQNASYTRTRNKEQPPLTAEDKALLILGLRKGAQEKEIIAAYRALAKRYHPDVSSKTGREMIEVNRAYERLTKC